MSVIGIDLETTSSSVAVWRNGNVEIIENDAGTPSYIAFTNTERRTNHYDSLKSGKLKDEEELMSLERAIYRTKITRTDFEKFVCDLKNTPELMLSTKMHSILITSCNEALHWIDSGSSRSHQDYDTKKYELFQLSEYLKQEAVNKAFTARKALEIYACNSKLNVDTSWGDSLVSQFNAYCDDVLSRIEIEDLRPEREYEFMRVHLVINLQSIINEAKRANLARAELIKYTKKLLNNSDSMLSKHLKSKLNASCDEILNWVKSGNLRIEREYMIQRLELQKICETLKNQAIRNAYFARDHLEESAMFLKNNPDPKLPRDSKNKLETTCNDIIEWLNSHELKSQEEYERRNQELSDLRNSLRNGNKSIDDDHLRVVGNKSKEKAPNEPKDKGRCWAFIKSSKVRLLSCRMK